LIFARRDRERVGISFFQRNGEAEREIFDELGKVRVKFDCVVKCIELFERDGDGAIEGRSMKREEASAEGRENEFVEVEDDRG